jgi:hypothetical protein
VPLPEQIILVAAMLESTFVALAAGAALAAVMRDWKSG